jgi:glutamyl-tRNA synthetase
VPFTPELERRIRRLALTNAVEHEGTPRPGPILSRLLGSTPELRSDVPALETYVQGLLDEIARLTPEERTVQLTALGGPEPSAVHVDRSVTGDLPPLVGAVDGQVVLRMAPFPSGGLHIGSARMIFVNDYYRRRYHGKLLLVFDDTIGSEEKRVDPLFFDLIQKDLELAGAPPDAVYYKSDRLPLFYQWARRVIDAGGSYVCRCPAELLRENRRAGVACAERTQAVPETLAEWEKMLQGGYREGEAVLRLRTDLHDPDPAFRDRVLFRISEVEHPRVGRKYRVWPLLEFSWAVDDIELGVTHVVRGKDLVMEDRMQRYIWDLLHIRGPPFLHWGLLRLREAKISKSKSQLEVRSGLYDGWSDPRTWSLGSLDRRGISMEALRRFTLSFGISLADIETPAETLYAENRQVIDPISARRSVVLDAVRVEVDAFPPDLRTVVLANHPDIPELGTRSVPVGPEFWLARPDLLRHQGSEIRLKDLVNIQLPNEVPEQGDGPVRATFTSRENRRIPRVQWVSALGAVPVDILGTEGEHRVGLGEAELLRSAERQILQFERVGFVRIEANWTPGSEPVRACYGHP